MNKMGLNHEKIRFFTMNKWDFLPWKKWDFLPWTNGIQRWLNHMISWSSNRHGQWDGDGRWGFLSEVASWKISHIHWVKYPQRYQARASLEDTNLFPGQLFKTRGVSNKNRLSYPQIIQVVLENVPLPSGSQSGWKMPHFITMIFPWKKTPFRSIPQPWLKSRLKSPCFLTICSMISG